MTDLKQKALEAQFDVIGDYIKARTNAGETVIELFEWHPDCGYMLLFDFCVTEKHVRDLVDGLGLKEYTTVTETDEDGIWWWKKTTHTYYWYTIVL